MVLKQSSMINLIDTWLHTVTAALTSTCTSQQYTSLRAASSPPLGALLIITFHTLHLGLIETHGKLLPYVTIKISSVKYPGLGLKQC